MTTYPESSCARRQPASGSPATIVSAATESVMASRRDDDLNVFMAHHATNGDWTVASLGRTVFQRSDVALWVPLADTDRGL
jgi:hypothetical protein